MDTVVLNIVEPVAESVSLAIAEPVIDTVLLSISEVSAKKDFRQEWVAPYNYIGKAAIGSDEAATVWIIYQIEVHPDGSVTIKSASGVKWTERLTILYT